MPEAEPRLSELVPGAVGEWRVEGEDRLYDRQGLYEYIDGGAELYISYGYERLFSRTFSKPGQPSMIVDLFDMGSSRNAFGVFSQQLRL